MAEGDAPDVPRPPAPTGVSIADGDPRRAPAGALRARPSTIRSPRHGRIPLMTKHELMMTHGRWNCRSRSTRPGARDADTVRWTREWLPFAARQALAFAASPGSGLARPWAFPTAAQLPASTGAKAGPEAES